MRDKLATTECINALTGQLQTQNGATGNTAVGASIDTNGFFGKPAIIFNQEL